MVSSEHDSRSVDAVPSSTGPVARLSALLGSTAGIAVAMAVMNVGTYGFQMVCARVLGPAAYSAVASMTALLLVLSVVQLGLQATAARRLSTMPGDIDQIEHTVLSFTWRATWVLTALALAVSPLVWHVLRLDGPMPAIVLALCVMPTTVMGGQAGILQGERRWLALSLFYLSAGVPRLLLGLVFLQVSATETAAMLAVLASLWLPVGVGAWILRRHDDAAPAPQSPEVRRDFVRETLGSSVALLAFFALSNLDVVVARSVLDVHDAGLYAGALILTKAVLFLPQFAVVILFPSMSTEHESRAAVLRGGAFLAAIGLLCAAGAWVLSSVALIFIGGDEYTEVQSRLWIFAALGGLLAVLQFLVYAGLARRGRTTKYVVGLGVLVLVGLGSTADSVDGLLTTVVAVDVVVVALLVALQTVRHRNTSR